MKDINKSLDNILAQLHHPALASIEPGLERVSGLLQALDNPQHRLPPVIHVAGTNGKGSLLAYLTSIFKVAGYKVHRYTSPHLVRFNERIMVAGEEIEDTQLLDVLMRVKEKLEDYPVTFFEATTAAAFLAFSEAPADVVLLETGMGGRLDATNVVDKPLLTAITPVAMDHMEFLGNTLAKISYEKAGIIKAGVPCVLGPQVTEALRVIKQTAQKVGASLYTYNEDWYIKNERYCSNIQEIAFTPALAGEHQIANAATAIACVDQLKGFSITAGDIKNGIAYAEWPARLQRLVDHPYAKLLPAGMELWLDGGHNPHAGEMLAAWAKAQAKPLHIICGMIQSKDTEGFLKPLTPYIESFYAVEIPQEVTSQPAEAIQQAASNMGVKNALSIESLEKTIQALCEKKIGNILICGSLYLAGHILIHQTDTN